MCVSVGWEEVYVSICACMYAVNMYTCVRMRVMLQQRDLSMYMCW